MVAVVGNNVKLDILNTGSSVDTDNEAIGILLKDIKTSQIISTFLKQYMKQEDNVIINNKKLGNLSQKLDIGAGVDGPKHLPKYFDI